MSPLLLSKRTFLKDPADASNILPVSSHETWERNAISGAILNVSVDKVEQIHSSETVGYEPLGGDGYVQFRVGTATVAMGAGTMAATFNESAIAPCLYPGAAGGAAGASAGVGAVPAELDFEIRHI